MSVLPITPAAAPGPPHPPLREQRRRQLRQQLSNTATGMFLEHGFDAVRVADVARACGVTEKTVFNHFPTKESLLADRWDTMIEAVRASVGDPQVSPVDAVLDVLERELDFLTAPPEGTHLGSWIADLARFSDLVRSTPSLITHERESLDRLTASIAADLAGRAGTPPEDPENWITAVALTGLWSVFYRTLHQHLHTGDASGTAHAVRRDLRRAAHVLTRGL